MRLAEMEEAKNIKEQLEKKIFDRKKHKLNMLSIELESVLKTFFRENTESTVSDQVTELLKENPIHTMVDRVFVVSGEDFKSSPAGVGNWSNRNKVIAATSLMVVIIAIISVFNFTGTSLNKSKNISSTAPSSSRPASMVNSPNGLEPLRGTASTKLNPLGAPKNVKKPKIPGNKNTTKKLYRSKTDIK